MFIADSGNENQSLDTAHALLQAKAAQSEENTDVSNNYMHDRIVLGLYVVVDILNALSINIDCKELQQMADFTLYSNGAS